MFIIACGDSYTQGEGLEKQTQAYPYLLNADIKNLAQSGASEYLITTQIEQAVKLKPDLIVVGHTSEYRWEVWDARNKCQQGFINQECRLKLEKMRGDWTQTQDPKIDPLKYWDRTSLLVQKVKISNGKKVSYGDTVVINYSIHRLDGLSLYVSPKRFRFNILDRNVIAGLRLGIRRMRVGERAKLYVPAEMAYGWKGLEGVVAPHTDIIIRVWLRRVLS